MTSLFNTQPIEKKSTILDVQQQYVGDRLLLNIKNSSLKCRVKPSKFYDKASLDRICKEIASGERIECYSLIITFNILLNKLESEDIVDIVENVDMFRDLYVADYMVNEKHPFEHFMEYCYEKYDGLLPKLMSNTSFKFNEYYPVIPESKFLFMPTLISYDCPSQTHQNKTYAKLLHDMILCSVKDVSDKYVLLGWLPWFASSILFQNFSQTMVTLSKKEVSYVISQLKIAAEIHKQSVSAETTSGAGARNLETRSFHSMTENDIYSTESKIELPTWYSLNKNWFTYQYICDWLHYCLD